ncbi:MAG TPA: DUF6496 domain-containing protein [Stellaceae bacterium]|jgi:hypothetical protein
MAPPVPKTKAGKQRKVARVMHEWGEGTLKSSSGAPVKNQKQAVAIALNESGQSKPPSERKNARKGGDGTTRRLAERLDRRLDQRMRR